MLSCLVLSSKVSKGCLRRAHRRHGTGRGKKEGRLRVMTVLMQLIIKMQASSSRSDQVRILVLVLVLLLLVGLFGAGPAWSGWPGWSGPLPSSSLDTFFFLPFPFFPFPFFRPFPLLSPPSVFGCSKMWARTWDMGHWTCTNGSWERRRARVLKRARGARTREC